MIEWHRVTWYSKLAAVLFFIGVLPVWTFYIGMQYEKTRAALDESPITFYTGGQYKPVTLPIPVPSGTSTTGNGTVSSTDSGVDGTVTVGPTCPVERIPPDPNCADRPYQTTLVIASTIIGKNGGVLVKTDAQGHYKADLAPGTYTIRAQSTMMLPRLSPMNFLVREHQYTELNLLFDSGIR